MIARRSRRRMMRRCCSSAFARAVEVGADGRRAARRLAVLAPEVVAPVFDVVRGAVGVHREDDPDLAVVDDVRDPRGRPVALGRASAGLPGSSGGSCARRRGAGHRSGLRPALVGPDVIRNLHGPQVAALVALADRENVRRLPGTQPRPQRPRRPSRRTCGTPPGPPESPGRRRLRALRRGRTAHLRDQRSAGEGRDATSDAAEGRAWPAGPCRAVRPSTGRKSCWTW